MNKKQIEIRDALLIYLRKRIGNSANKDQYPEHLEAMGFDINMIQQVINLMLDQGLVKYEGKESYFLRLTDKGLKTSE